MCHSVGGGFTAGTKAAIYEEFSRLYHTINILCCGCERWVHRRHCEATCKGFQQMMLFSFNYSIYHIYYSLLTSHSLDTPLQKVEMSINSGTSL